MTDNTNTDLTTTDAVAPVDNSLLVFEQLVGRAGVDLELIGEALQEVLEANIIENDYGERQLKPVWAKLVQPMTDRDGITVPRGANNGDIVVPMRTLFDVEEPKKLLLGRVVFAHQTFNYYPEIGSGERIEKLSPRLYQLVVPEEDRAYNPGRMPKYRRAYSFIVLTEDGQLVKLEFAKSAAKTGKILYNALAHMPQAWAVPIGFSSKEMSANNNKWHILQTTAFGADNSDEELMGVCKAINAMLAFDHAASDERAIARYEESLAHVKAGGPDVIDADVDAFGADDELDDM